MRRGGNAVHVPRPDKQRRGYICSRVVPFRVVMPQFPSDGVVVGSPGMLGLSPPVEVGAGVAVDGSGVAVGVGVGAGVSVGAGVGVGVGAGVPVGSGVGDGSGDGLGSGLGVGLGSGVGSGVGDGSGVGSGVSSTGGTGTGGAGSDWM